MDNRPTFPEDQSKQFTQACVALSESPVSTSDIASGFAGGERNIGAVFEALRQAELLGHARLTELGWVVSEPGKSIKSGSARSMRNWSLETLLESYAAHNRLDTQMTGKDWAALQALFFELNHRKTPRARELVEKLRHRLSVNGKLMPSGRPDGFL